MSYARVFIDDLIELPHDVERKVRYILEAESLEDIIGTTEDDSQQATYVKRFLDQSRYNARSCSLKGDWKASLFSLIGDLARDNFQCHTSEKLWNADLKPSPPGVAQPDDEIGVLIPRFPQPPSVLLDFDSQSASGFLGLVPSLQPYTPSIAYTTSSEAADPFYISTLKPDIFNINRSTGERLLRDSDRFGDITDSRSGFRAYKQDITRSTGSGRPTVVSDDQLQAMLRAPPKVRSSKLADQISRVGISASERTVQRRLWAVNAKVYRASKAKRITPSQVSQRLDYWEKYRLKPVLGFWDGVIFTEEAHMSMSELPPQRILKVRGERLKPKNIISTPSRTATDVHFAAWVNYYDRQPDLVFYNDEMDDIVIKNYHQSHVVIRQLRLRINIKLGLLTGRPRRPVIQLFLVRATLSRRDTLRVCLHPDHWSDWCLMEDNDPSHGTKNPDSVPSQYGENLGIKTLRHAANSPDFNPIESLWEIIKERVKRYIHQLNTINELKSALQTEWRNITQDNVQRWIKEMPKRLPMIEEFWRPTFIKSIICSGGDI
ncbi:hypothetical protein KJE20_14067 [Pyrenophora tritici-repentis]|nr:hypothetical protein KJE20_14067 [Pyrenophora tritici-repentis]